MNRQIERTHGTNADSITISKIFNTNVIHILENKNIRFYEQCKHLFIRRNYVALVYIHKCDSQYKK